MKSFIRFFSSVKLAIFLIIIITLASTLGTLIPQQRSPAEYASRFGQISGLLTRLEITDLYHSWWYLGLLILFSLNILVCTLTRLSPKLRRALRPKTDFSAKSLLHMKTRISIKKNEGLESTQTRLEKLLRSRRYRLLTQRKEKGSVVLARKRMLGLFGSDFVHLGLLVILSGGIITGAAGFRTTLNISEGEILPVPGADFQVRLDAFETEYYPDGAVRDWKSTLTVIDGGEPRLTKTIEVNHPLGYKGFLLYQSSYGWDWRNPSLRFRAKKKSDPSYSRRITLKIGEKVALEGENLEILATRFVPDFILNERKEVATRSLNPHNPAAFIEGWRGGERIFSGWIFARYPDFAQLHGNEESDLAFELEDFEAAQYSGLQVARDPGANIIWAGCTILMIGLLVAFFWLPREVKVVLEEAQGKTEIVAGGIAGKNREDFQAEFTRIFDSLRRSK